MTTTIKEFQELIERMFSDFATRHHVTSQDFFENCRDTMEGRYLPLFEEHKNKWFVELLLDLTSFDNFINRMLQRIKRRRSHK